MALVDDISRDVRQLFPKAPEDAVRHAIIRAARQFCGQSRWYRVALTATLSPNVQAYSLGSDPLLEVVDVPLGRITDTNGAILSLQPSDPTTFDPNVKPGRPTTYAYLPEGSVAFFPIPNAAYAVTLTLAVQPKDGVSELPDQLLAKWRVAIEAGAAAFLYELPEAWRDLNQAEIKRRTLQSAINSARADVARGYQSGSVIANRRPFIVG